MTNDRLHRPRSTMPLTPLPSRTATRSLDSDRLLVLVVAVVLVQNDAPMELILALLYVAM